jgi:hypothetical protein
METLLQALGDSGLAAWLRRPGPAYPLANAAHILSLGLLVGSIAILDLRLLGAFRRAPVSVLGTVLPRVAAAALASTIATGVMLLSVRPLVYVANPALLVKLTLVALGIANALAVHLNPAWRRALDDDGVTTSLRVQALASLAIWVAAVVAGRWIAFLM